MPSAAERVFAIPELLEPILLLLGTRDLLLSQRTCKDFHATVAASNKRQRALFLQQGRPPDGHPIHNPLFEHRKLPFISRTGDLTTFMFIDTFESSELRRALAASGEGANWKRMYLNHSPVLDVKYGQPLLEPRYEVEKIKLDTRMTVGEMMSSISDHMAVRDRVEAFCGFLALVVMVIFFYILAG